MGKVMVFASYAPSLINFRGHLLDELRSRGHEVIACAPKDPKVAEELKKRGVEFLGVGPARASLNPVADLKYFLQLLVACRRIRPSAVLSYTAKPVIWSSLAARFCRVPRIASMITGLGVVFTSSARFGIWPRRLTELLYRVSLRCCDKVVFQNPDDQQEFIERRFVRESEKSFVVNGSGVDLQHFAFAPMPERPVFLLIARLLVPKGIREYAKAANIVKQRFSQAQFRLVGWIDANPASITETELMSWREAGLVDYRGHLQDVRPELSEARVYVLPSYYREGVPRTVLEAMSVGRPIITTDTPGCRETVRHGWNGLLVKPRDPEGLAAAMCELLEKPELAVQMGSRSRRLAEEKYDSRAVAVSVLDGVGL